MEYLEKIKLLKSQNKFTDMSSIKYWLKENKNTLKKAIKNTSCHKWKKWERNNSLHIFPCISNLCEIRNEECRFIEFYKLLITYINTVREDEFYKKLIETHNNIKHNQNAIYEWIIDIEKYGNELVLINDEVIFKDEKDKKLISLKLDKDELRNLWNFKNIYNSNYYSLKFKKYINN